MPLDSAAPNTHVARTKAVKATATAKSAMSGASKGSGASTAATSMQSNTKGAIFTGLPDIFGILL